MEKYFYIETFGCQMNKLDAELMTGELMRDGWTETADRTKADLFLFITCAVREHAEDKFYSHLGACKKFKKRNSNLVIAVAGCVAQKEAERMTRRSSLVDLVCGTRRIADIVELVERVRVEGGPIVATEDDTALTVPERYSAARRSPFRAFISVMRGCDNYCAYCIVPYVRGRVVSRSPEEVEEEAKRLVDEGVVELTLLGQNVSAYGSDGNGEWTLSGLLEKVAAVKGIRRLKFITSHPKWTTEDIFKTMGANPIIAPYLHMPAQSGSDRMLAAMKRGYTKDYYLELVEKARRWVSDLEISGDFILGFPGETDEDFSDTVELVKRVEYKNIFAFKYSPRPPAKSAALEDDVPPEIKQERLARLLELAKDISQNRLSGMTGKTVEVLVEGPSKKNPQKYAGRTGGDIIVIIEGAEGLEGKFAEVKIDHASAVSLYGTIVE